MKKSLQYVGAAALAFAFAGSAQAITLTDLLGGGSVTAGDKLLDSWEVLFQDSSDFAQVNTDNIDVTALNDGGLDPGPGLQFDILNDELGVIGDDIFAYRDFQFGFRVSVLDPDLAIKDVSLSYSAYIGYTADGFNDNGSYIQEYVGTALGLNDLTDLSVEFSVLDDSLTDVNNVAAGFNPRSEIWVTKNILVWATDSTDSAGIDSFNQRFSQTTVPEPASIALIVLGLAGFGVARRRRD
jgi:hypothetical protein